MICQKPLRRFDTEIEYVPTQLICEYCKQNGADGIQFNSSLHQGGVNVVLFNPSDAQCVGVSKFGEIKKGHNRGSIKEFDSLNLFL
jgi:RES domain.